jgi:hypothetical protein
LTNLLHFKRSRRNAFCQRSFTKRFTDRGQIGSEPVEFGTVVEFGGVVGEQVHGEGLEQGGDVMHEAVCQKLISQA